VNVVSFNEVNVTNCEMFVFLYPLKKSNKTVLVGTESSEGEQRMKFASQQKLEQTSVSANCKSFHHYSFNLRKIITATATGVSRQ